MKLAIIGGGWAGLAAAVAACRRGDDVHLFEMAGQLGGRARTVGAANDAFDNGQHILIGAYRQTLDLMRTLGAEPQALLHRMPLELRYPDGRGLRMPAGPAWLGFGRAVMGCRGWVLSDRLALLRAAAGWAAAGFRCDPALTVDALCRSLPPAVRALLIDPLCVAALNTPAAEASASVWLRVLRDALFGGAGAADLLLPRRPLGQLLPDPAASWLAARGATISLGHRVQHLERVGNLWLVSGVAFDGVVLACTAAESARLCDTLASDWSAQARALRYEPIITVYLQADGARLQAPMMALDETPQHPAQFVFDQGALGGPAGRFAFVVSGARRWIEQGLDACGPAVLQQARSSFPAGTWPAPPHVLRVLAEKRATFRCTPDLRRPAAAVAPGLVAAGDYIDGPYPATLEGAVRSGEQAVASLR